MTWDYKYIEKINLFVDGRIEQKAADRQMKTARELLERFKTQPGVILADEVGTGKTFVALATAASIVLQKEGSQVVIMIPISLQEKWPRDFRLFQEQCLPKELQGKISCASARRAVDFMKLLDDPLERRKSLIFLSHGAMSTGLSNGKKEGLVKLAIIQRAIKGRKNADSLRNALNKYVGKIIGLESALTFQDDEIWERLLKHDPSEWLGILRKSKIELIEDGKTMLDDDPVPETVILALENMNTDSIYNAIQKIPKYDSLKFDERIVDARRTINEEIKVLWKECVRQLKYKLPLLVFDEAHHLKNEGTILASLFRTKESSDDADVITKGSFSGVFERMLFLTATPFQLGHHELCSVLERFGAIDWNSIDKDNYDLERFNNQLAALRSVLDKAQQMAISLDTVWGKLTKEDLCIEVAPYSDVLSWWNDIKDNSRVSEMVKEVRRRYSETKTTMKEAEECLKPWIIRNNKEKTIKSRTGSLIRRREQFYGKAIIDNNTKNLAGISLEENELLPFLLAARAVMCNPDQRPIFAEGLASSYEAFLNTKEQREKAKEEKFNESTLDGDDDSEDEVAADDNCDWYITKLLKYITNDDGSGFSNHPKIEAIAEKAINLWNEGEKVIVFCHYIRTGRSLRQCISNKMDDHILKLGAKKLKIEQGQVLEILTKIGGRLEVDSPMRRVSNKRIKEILDKHNKLHEFQDSILSIIGRYIRTPSFLARFFPLEISEDQKYPEEAIITAFETKDSSELSFSEMLDNFFTFLSERCSASECKEYIDALDSIQRAAYRGADIRETFSDDEIQNARPERLLSNVRLINGEVRHETRKKLMLTFNTPFYPEILICSNVMAEGVDLQLYCRHVIHHDLCWNPSTLEQRTGRVDRIGAKAEQCGLPIMVYIPYISETQDQKMFEVVMDRERWLKVVMGGKMEFDVRSTEKQAGRIPLPDELAEELTFKLGLENEDLAKSI